MNFLNTTFQEYKDSISNILKTVKRRNFGWDEGDDWSVDTTKNYCNEELQKKSSERVSREFLQLASTLAWGNFCMESLYGVYQIITHI